MNQARSAAPSTRPPTPKIPPDRPDLRPLVLFAAVALGVGAPLLTLSTLIEPAGPFILAAVLAGLALPALVLTHRDTGGEGVRALLRDCVRLPRAWWWLPVAGFALPCLTWATAAVLGGAHPLTWSLLGWSNKRNARDLDLHDARLPNHKRCRFGGPQAEGGTSSRTTGNFRSVFFSYSRASGQ